MAYVDEMLDPGEQVIYRARVGTFFYIGALLWAPAYFLLTLSPGPVFSISSTELALTDRRVIGRYGVLLKQKIALSYRELERIHVSRGLLGWLLGYGKVTVIGFDGRRMVFKGIADPLELQRCADERIEKAILGHALPRLGDALPGASPSPAPPPVPRMGQGVLPPESAKAPVFGKKSKDPTAW